MSSQRRIDASRANGAKSRGPVTAEGKRKSSANSIRHGLLAETVVLEDERSDLFFELLADLTREHNPQTETQRILVETMGIARWRQMRIWALERETMQTQVDRTPPGTNGPAARAGLAFRTLADNGRVLDLLNRYETSLDRQYSRALNLLIKLADPNSPLTQFRETNPSGVGLPACPAAEGGSPHPSTDPAPNTEPPESGPAQPEKPSQKPSPVSKSPIVPISRPPRAPQSQKSGPAAEIPPTDWPQTE